jgi:tRNA A-37 threonylcarbamoyl transferase component Bud32
VHIDLEHRLKAGDETPLVEFYLQMFPEVFADSVEAMKLIGAEYLWGWRRQSGITKQEYLRRFAHFGAELEQHLTLVWDCEKCSARQTIVDEAAETLICSGCGSSLRVRARITREKSPAATAQPLPKNPSWPVIPGFEILDELGRGGMGVVFRATQERLNRTIALKMIRDGALARDSELHRFQREAETAAHLQHPAIVAVYEVGDHNGLPFFAMELVQGGSLEKRLGGKPQPARSCAELVEKLAQAVHYAHQKEIIHRDLKPANVLLTAEGLPKITDFGLAKFLDPNESNQSEVVLGTASYMSPEQADPKKHKVGSATDVYALGAILYESLTGRPPFRGSTRRTAEGASGPRNDLFEVPGERPRQALCLG